MRKIVVVPLMLFSALTLLSQQREENHLENKGYLRALKYIVNSNKQKNILVSDTLVPLHFATFSKDLDTFYINQKHPKFYDLLDSVDQAKDTSERFCPVLKNKQSKHKGKTEIIYFSPVYDHMLIGEILERQYFKKWYGLNHHAQAGFNQSMQYLFIFDKKYNIQKIFKATIAYD